MCVFEKYMEKWRNQNTENGFELIFCLCFIKDFIRMMK